MILIIGERVNNLRLTDAQVADWLRVWKKHGWAAALRTPAMVYGPARKRLDGVLPGQVGTVKLIVNLLPPDNKCGTWDTGLAREVVEQALSWLITRGERISGIILLGYRVRRAFENSGDMQSRHFPHTHISGKPVLGIPHPSLRNRLWNQEMVEAEIKEFLCRTQIRN